MVVGVAANDSNKSATWPTPGDADVENQPKT